VVLINQAQRCRSGRLLTGVELFAH